MDKIKKLVSPINIIGLSIQLLFLFFIKSFSPNLIIIIVFYLISTVILLYINIAEFEKKSKKQEDFRKTLESIVTINNSILQIENIEELYQQILKGAVGIVNDAKMGSLLIMRDDNYMEFKATEGFSFINDIDLKIRLEDTFLYRKTKGQLRDACIIKDVDEFNKDVIGEEVLGKVIGTDFFITKSSISAPIIIDGVLYGMINVDSPKKNAFKDRDLLLMEYFASQVGTVIQRHQLLEEMKCLSQYDSLTNVYNRS